MSWLAVALGGALGAMARYAMGLLFVPVPGQFPIATFWVNALGCLLMGIVFALMVDKQWLPYAWRPFLMVGLLGAFTTFSTFAIEVLGLWHTQHFGTAVGYIVASLTVNLFAVWLGYTLTVYGFK